MALPFVPSDAAMLAVQAAVVAAPRADPPGLDWLRRLGGRGWALLPLGSIVVVIAAIGAAAQTATDLTYLALVAVPILAALALGWAVRGARPVAALAVIPLFAAAWIWRTSLVGEAAAVALSALSAVTLGILLAALTPPSWLKVGIVLMAIGDSYLVATDLLQKPNNVLTAAHPAAGLPQLQSELFGTVQMGYGDLFIAAVLGAVLASDRGRQLQAALLTLLFAAAFDLLFFAVNELPATVPVALALIASELWRVRAERTRRADRRSPARGSPRAGAAGGVFGAHCVSTQTAAHVARAVPGPEPTRPSPAQAKASADPRPSRPADATPRPGM
ncbi:MAG TPA: hypothetical protein VG294_06880 [Solirubrobacteraceae bacterium]|nr:hypothetical protein [Solirubrobacteraceae bacterium]